MNSGEVRSIGLPPSKSNSQTTAVRLRDRVLVVVGANGSGKTRLGAWIEARDIKLNHRISAHRSLRFPDRTQPTDIDEAERHLRYGSTEPSNSAHYHQHSRWSNNPAVALLNDYEPLVKLLVSESFSVSDRYRVDMQSADTYVPPPRTRMDVVKDVWEGILPNRRLLVTGSRIEACNVADNVPYHAREMSDGERGIFYLIAEALSAPSGGIFIVDEPELHLHRAIQAKLWDAIEAARPDCLFVYITHDLGFAASRVNATKVWLKEYVSGKWDWEEVPELEGLPESMLLELLGSRQPVKFIEGERGSLDYFVYSKIFDLHTVVPCGSCEHVVHATQSFTNIADLHHIACDGLVDNDGRTESDISKLAGLKVSVLPVALVENLFLLDPVLRIAANRLGYKHDEVLDGIHGRILAELKRSKERVVSNLSRQEVEEKLRRLGRIGVGKAAFVSDLAGAISGLTPSEIYERWDAEVERAIVEADYESALRYFKRKGLSSFADAVFKLNYQEQVMRWLRTDGDNEIVVALRTAVG